MTTLVPLAAVLITLPLGVLYFRSVERSAGDYVRGRLAVAAAYHALRIALATAALFALARVDRVAALASALAFLVARWIVVRGAHAS